MEADLDEFSSYLKKEDEHSILNYNKMIKNEATSE